MIIYYTNNYDKKIMDSHRLLEEAIAVHTGDEEKAAALVSELYQSTEYGKPAIPGFADFSITHSDNCWAVLINGDFRKEAAGDADEEQPGVCGLDVQFEKSSDYEIVCRRYYSDEEQSVVELSGKSEFYRLWARREALVKAVGTTIVNKNLPSVIKDEVEFEGFDWIIQDVTIPDIGDEAHAAICYRADSISAEKAVFCNGGRGIGSKEVRYVEIRK